MAEKDLKDQAIPDNAAGNTGDPVNAGAEAGFDLNTDENQAGTTHLNEPLSESGEDKLKAELNEAKDKYLRLVAEFENYKRRNSKERLELIQTAGREVISSILDVLDDADRAQKQLDSTTDLAQIKEGITLVFGKLRNTLQGKGLKAMDTIGTEFNADLHEAITEVPVPDDKKGKVVDEVMKGYYLNDKIIRHARVVVGKQ